MKSAESKITYVPCKNVASFHWVQLLFSDFEDSTHLFAQLPEKCAPSIVFRFKDSRAFYVTFTLSFLERSVRIILKLQRLVTYLLTVIFSRYTLQTYRHTLIECPRQLYCSMFFALFINAWAEIYTSAQCHLRSNPWFVLGELLSLWLFIFWPISPTFTA